MNRQDWGGDFRDGFLGNVEHQLGGKQWLKMGPEMTGRGITRGVARGSGAAAQRNRITERAHPGIRGADGENRQGELPSSRTTQTGEGGRNANRADVCSELDDPHRFPKSREVGCFLGLRPGRRDVV